MFPSEDYPDVLESEVASLNAATKNIMDLGSDEAAAMKTAFEHKESIVQHFADNPL